eukprot:TRINITY_DN27071_c0_g1_i1.p1 TRINITY_DN27071_c0_g1~~TRINITY_DN27071_c0_g1_i1.p1  ORF type:complete len:699 (-),score=75.02 TRINITY_DN27071_c0_g1_i1:162-2237(-)
MARSALLLIWWLVCGLCIPLRKAAVFKWQPIELWLGSGLGVAVQLERSAYLLCHMDDSGPTGMLSILNTTTLAVQQIAKQAPTGAGQGGIGRSIAAFQQTVYVLGGTRNGGMIQDVSLFNIATGAWQAPVPCQYSPRSFGTAFVHLQTLYFGLGLDWAGQARSDLWVLVGGVWVRVEDSDPHPPPAAFPYCTVVNGTAVFFSGLLSATTKAVAPADLWVFNISAAKWSVLANKGTAFPAARWMHTIAAYQNNIVLFRGLTADGALLTDLWLFDTSRGSWAALSQDKSLGPPDTQGNYFSFLDLDRLFLGGDNNISFSLSLDPPITVTRTHTTTGTVTLSPSESHRNSGDTPRAAVPGQITRTDDSVTCKLLAIILPTSAFCVIMQATILYHFCRRRRRRYLLEGGEWYLLEEVLGRGNYGQVFKGMNRATRELVAMKQFDSPTLQREVGLLIRFSHPNIVRYLGTCETAKFGSMVILELCANGSVAALLERSGPLPIEKIKEIMKDVLQGLAYLHSMGVVHRDVKPPNILIADTGVCKLADFGVSRETSSLPTTASITGTLRYLSPEALNGKVSPAQDVWASGVTAIELKENRVPWANLGMFVSDAHLLGTIITGRYPIPKDLPRNMTEFLELCLRKNHDTRWQAVQLLEHPFLSETNVSPPSTRSASAFTTLPSVPDTAHLEEVFRRIEL